MSTNSRQVAQKSKVSTLPEDLKSIAEEMLRKKFGEESPPAMGGTFQRQAVSDTASVYGRGCGDSFCMFCVAGPEYGCGGRYTRHNINSRRRYNYTWECSSIYVSLDSAWELVKRANYENASRDDREFVLGPGEIDELLRDPRSQSALRISMGVKMLFDIPVRVVGYDMKCIVLRCY